MLEEMDEAACKVLIREFEGKRSFGELDINGMMIFEWILSKYGVDQIYFA